MALKSVEHLFFVMPEPVQNDSIRPSLWALESVGLNARYVSLFRRIERQYSLYEIVCATAADAPANSGGAAWDCLRDRCVYALEKCGYDNSKQNKMRVLLLAAEPGGNDYDSARPLALVEEALESCFGEDPFRHLWLKVARSVFESVRINKFKLAATEIPVALYTPGDGKGVLGRLRLELHEGDGCCANHPAQFVGTSFRVDVHEAMGKAWEGARKLARQDSTNYIGEVNGTWMLIPWNEAAGTLDLDSLPYKQLAEPDEHGGPVRGPSFTAAAARAWTLLLTRRVIDPRLLVIGQLAADGETILPVSAEGVLAKTRKVVDVCREAISRKRMPPIDRIAVVRDTLAGPAHCNLTVAKKAIPEELHGWLDAVDIAEAASAL